MFPERRDHGRTVMKYRHPQRRKTRGKSKMGRRILPIASKRETVSRRFCEKMVGSSVFAQCWTFLPPELFCFSHRHSFPLTIYISHHFPLAVLCFSAPFSIPAFFVIFSTPYKPALFSCISTKRVPQVLPPKLYPCLYIQL